ncbi:MAG: type II toxin-antitoxin system VapC family toxin [Actinobacteria bacterium]|nr:MAG: type II toxin-antitoxin system VapC family toxin [Actinomycetota bacterium]
MNRPVVCDASFAVKWFKDEAGSGTAMGLLEDHACERLDIHMPEQCVAEVLSVCGRWEPAPASIEAWVQLDMAGVVRHPLSDDLVRGAEAQMGALGCGFYDALAPALASMLGAALYSADSRAHGGFPGAVIVDS